MEKVMLEVNELTTNYVTRFRENIYAVDHVSLKVEEGKALGIAGESGCGKSTLALSLMGYYFAPLHYTSGEIIVDGQNISGMNPDDVRKTILGREVSYIPQAAMNALNPVMTVERQLLRKRKTMPTVPSRIQSAVEILPTSCSRSGFTTGR